ncbi:Bug family tripartite tricarboxylate transporter substrate binding protein [Muricoccus aerilatus]|uniref:Bug family tripartite tricarboxylate transporter substrate binding protein n=1 Tax=Muricoccus aerilatus TaxID=452982 RepID=UPI0005C1F8B6|nr:tripartite tricarboxylate transporter substrate binding protein [Roseomonas aerilata]
MPVGRRTLLATAVALGAATRPRSARAQAGTFPSRPVRVIVAASAGSAPDTAMRLLADRLAARWRQPVVVDNRPGAAGNIGAQAAARAEADGHVLLFSQASPLVLNQHLMRAMPFDPARDLAPITLVMNTPFILAAHAGLGLRSLADLAARGRQPGRALTLATSGATSLPRFAGEEIARGLGITLANIPYNGSPAAVADIIAGRTDLVIDGTPLLAPQVRSGTLVPLAITAADRMPGLEVIPTVAETVPGFARGGWFALLAPSATPPGVIERVASDATAVLAAPELRARLLNELGAIVSADGPAALASLLAAERNTLGRLVRELEVPIE